MSMYGSSLAFIESNKSQQSIQITLFYANATKVKYASNITQYLFHAFSHPFNLVHLTSKNSLFMPQKKRKVLHTLFFIQIVQCDWRNIENYFSTSSTNLVLVCPNHSSPTKIIKEPLQPPIKPLIKSMDSPLENANTYLYQSTIYPLTQPCNKNIGDHAIHPPLHFNKPHMNVFKKYR